MIHFTLNFLFTLVAAQLDKAQQVADAFKSLSTPLNYYATGLAIPVSLGMNQCLLQTNNLAVLGYVLVSDPGQIQNQTQTYNNVTAKMTDIADDFNFYFGRVLNQTCYDQLVADGSVILEAANGLDQLIAGNITEAQFTSLCSECFNATMNLITALAGQKECDLQQILYEGYTQAGFFKGWVDEFASKGGYLLSLANLGITVQSAYATLTTQQDWSVTQQQFQVLYATANTNLINNTVMCQTQWKNNAYSNILRMVEVTSGKTNNRIPFQADGVLGLTSRWQPYHLWYAIVSNGVTPGDDYWFICYDCYTYIGIASDETFEGYNDIISAVPLVFTPNATVMDVDLSVYDNRNQGAREIAEDIFANYCVKAIIVMRKNVIQHNRAYDFAGFRWEGDYSYYKFTLWAPEGFCEKESPTTPLTLQY